MHKLKFGVATVTILAMLFSSGCATFTTGMAGDLGNLNKIKHVHKDDIVKALGDPIYVDKRVNGTAYVWSDNTFRRVYDQVYHGSTVSGNVMTHHWEERPRDVALCSTIVFNKDGYPKGLRQSEPCHIATQNGGVGTAVAKGPLLGIALILGLAVAGSK